MPSPETHACRSFHGRRNVKRYSRGRAYLALTACVVLAFVLMDAHRRSAFERRRRLNRGHVYDAAQREGLPPHLLLAVAETESAWNERAVSHRGAVGLLQLMPATAAQTAKPLGLENRSLTDPAVNARLGAAYLRQMLDRYGGDPHLALAAYHAGPSRVENWRSRGPTLAGHEVVKQFGFAETARYVNTVLRRAENERQRPSPRQSPQPDALTGKGKRP